MSKKIEEFASELSDFLSPFAKCSILSASKKNAESPNSQSFFLPGETQYKLNIELNTESLKDLQEQIGAFLKESPNGTCETIPNWQEHIDQHIHHFFLSSGTSLHKASKSDKKALVLSLNENGFLAYQQATSYIAKVLKISRASVYNYLKESNTLTKVKAHQVDTFTTEKFKGNPAGVVLDADPLTDAQKRKITRALNVSETSFVLSSDKGDFRLRYFTPSGDEVIFCGHSSIGALYMIAQEGYFGCKAEKTSKFSVETLAGLIDMQVTISKNQEVTASYTSPKIHLKKDLFRHCELLDALELPSSLIDNSFPIYYEATSKDLFLQCTSLDELQNFSPNIKKMTAFSKSKDIVAICIFTTDTVTDSSHLFCRCFAPAVGIAEDPFTGSVQGALASIAHHEKLINTSEDIIIEQGHFMDRPGKVNVSLTCSEGHYTAQIKASATHCYSTEIKLA